MQAPPFYVRDQGYEYGLQYSNPCLCLAETLSQNGSFVFQYFFFSIVIQVKDAVWSWGAAAI